MCRSYFFALFACTLFSLGALSNAYSNLPGPGKPPLFHLSYSLGSLIADPVGTTWSTREGDQYIKPRPELLGAAPACPDSPPAPAAGSGPSLIGENPSPSTAGSDFSGATFPFPGQVPALTGEKTVLPGKTPALYYKAADGPGETAVQPGACKAAGMAEDDSPVSTALSGLPDSPARSGSASVFGAVPSNAGSDQKASTSQGDTGGESGLKTALASKESSGKGQTSLMVAAKDAAHQLGASDGDAVFPLNTLTDNFNILLLGVDKEKLEMVCVYSINHHFKNPPRSVSLFFPVNSVLQYKGKKETLDSIYAVGGWQALEEILEKEMFIDIAYYVKIDRQALRDLEQYFEPIYVDGEKVEMETLFVRRTSNKDDRIIARILKQVLRPEVFFRYIPSLVFGINRDIESNFNFTPQNLVFHYRLAKKLSTKRIEKIVLFGTTDWQEGRRVNIPRKEDLGSAIYLATR